MPPRPARLRFQTALRSDSESASDLGTSLSFSPGQDRLSVVDRCFHISAPLCDHCLVLGLLVATGLPNQIITAMCAAAGISLSTEGHPRRSKTPLDFGVSSGPKYIKPRKWNLSSRRKRGFVAAIRFRDAGGFGAAVPRLIAPDGIICRHGRCEIEVEGVRPSG